jgi:hypothetical protein
MRRLFGSGYFRSAAVIVSISALGITAMAPAASADSHRDRHRSSDPVVLTRGLNNPRQLSLVDNGALLIAEAGKAGTACSGSGQDEQCIGATGSVSAVFLPQAGTQRDHLELVTGLISGGGPDGSFVVGSDGASQRHFGSPIYIQETFAPLDVLPAGIPGDQSGQLLAAKPFGKAKPVADITAFERAKDPDKKGFDSDPYAVVAREHDELVADAAGNDILRVDHNGKVSVFHVFPNIVDKATTTPTDQFPGFDPTPAFPGVNFVPTSIAIGPNGDVYVGGLGGELPGQGRVVKLDGRSGHVEHTWTGFTSVSGVAVGRDGSLYVSQLEAPEAHPAAPMVVGVLTKVSRNGTRHNVDVPFPAGVAVDKWDNVFVSAFSVAPGTGLSGAPAGFDSSGQVWRLHF